MSYDGGYGVTFNIGDGPLSGTPTYTPIGQVKSWNGLEIEAVLSEVTHHASPGGYDEHVPSGLMKTSEIELEIALDMAGATHANAADGLAYNFLNRVKAAYQIILPDASETTWTFDAYIQKLKMDSPIEEHVMATVTLKPTGEASLT